MNSKKTKKVALLTLILSVLLYSSYFVLNHFRYETTDNAQIEGHIYQVNPKIGGQIQEILVDDNEYVEQGQVLLHIDKSDIELLLAQAKAGLAQIEAEKSAALAVMQASKSASKAAFNNITVANAKKERLNTDLVRFTNLLEEDIVPQSKIDDIHTQLEVISSQVEAARQQYLASNSKYQAAFLKINSIDAAIEAAKVNVRNAELKLSYTNVKAPASGRVSRKMIEEGQVIRSGQPLMAITDFTNLWVVANFKEGQVSKMTIGQQVNLSVDAFPDKEFKGNIESIAAATGSKFSLFPADNATGNFTKITQRIPVKITLQKEAIKDVPLRAGMNTVVKVIKQ